MSRSLAAALHLIALSFVPSGLLAATTYTYTTDYISSSIETDQTGCATAINYVCRDEYSRDDEVIFSITVPDAIAPNTYFAFQGGVAGADIFATDGHSIYGNTVSGGNFTTDDNGDVLFYSFSHLISGDRRLRRLTGSSQFKFGTAEYRQFFESEEGDPDFPNSFFKVETHKAKFYGGTGGWTTSTDIAPSPVPLPPAAAMLLAGFTFLGGISLKRQKPS